jgi:hypothetical protein
MMAISRNPSSDRNLPALGTERERDITRVELAHPHRREQWREAISSATLDQKL